MENKAELRERQEETSKWFPGLMPQGAGGWPAERSSSRMITRSKL